MKITYLLLHLITIDTYVIISNYILIVVGAGLESQNTKRMKIKLSLQEILEPVLKPSQKQHLNLDIRIRSHFFSFIFIVFTVSQQDSFWVSHLSRSHWLMKPPQSFVTISTLLCSRQGCKGQVIAEDSLDFKSNWTCDKCQQSVSHQDVEALLRELEEENQTTPVQKVPLENRIKALERLLHPNHNLILDLKFSLCQLYGHAKLAEPQAMINEARSKKRLCLEILHLMDAIVPGKFRLRGMFLLELYVVSLFLLRAQDEDPDQGKMDKTRFQRSLEELRGILQESIEILGFEPKDSIEGRRCQTALTYMEKLSIMIAGSNQEEPLSVTAS